MRTSKKTKPNPRTSRVRALPEIRNWSCCPGSSDPFVAPERAGIKVQGRVYGSPRAEDGTLITTSRVVDTDGRTVTTSSGSVYALGEPHPDYVAYLATIGRLYNPECPITVKR